MKIMKHVGGFEGSKETLGFLYVPLATPAHLIIIIAAQFFHLLKLITNRWAWALVPTKLVEPGNALGWGGGIHGNCASGPQKTPSHWTIQWNTSRPILTSRGREGGMGKNQSTKWHANSYLLPQHFAKNFKQASAYIISHEMPLPEASGHPSIAGKTADQHCLKVNFA